MARIKSGNGPRVISAIAALVLIAAVAAAAVVYAPVFEGMRRSAAAVVLNHAFKRPVTVAGAVNVSLGETIGVKVSGMEIAAPPWNQDGRPQFIDNAEFALPLWSTVTGHPQLTRLALNGAQIDFRLAQEAEPLPPGGDGDDVGGHGMAGFLSHILNHPAVGNLTIGNVRIYLKDEENGWNEEIWIERFVMLESADGMSITVDAKGTVNDLPLTIAGTLPNPRQVSGPGPVEITHTIPGLTTRTRGTLDAGKPVPVADVMVDAQADSLGDLLDVLKLERVLEGRGFLRTRLAGPIGGLTASELAAEADFASGDKVRLNGSLANVNDGEGFDLTAQVDLAVISRPADQPASVTDIDLTGFFGRLQGDIEALHIVDARIFTNIGSAELNDIGPITVDRINKDEKGRLGFIGIHVLAGPETDPFVDANGEIDDVLQLQGITMDGTVNAGAADLLGFAGPETAKLGRLKGRFAISDTDGILGVEDLAVTVVGSELLSLSLALAIDGLREVDDLRLDVDLDISDFSALAAALGIEVGKVGRAAFAGTLGLAKENADAGGSLTLGKTTLTGKLQGTVRDGRPHISGNISSKVLHLRDVRNVRALIAVNRKRKRNEDTKNTEAADGDRPGFDQLSVELDVAIASIAGGSKAVGGIKGELAYEAGEVTLAPLHIAFLGGTISGEARIDTRSSPKVIKTKGKIGKLNMSSVLKELGLDPVVTGTLNASFDLVAAGGSSSAALRSASGSLTASLWGGSIGTAHIDLAGLSVPRWLLGRSAQSGRANIVCAVVPLKLKNGRATSGSIVIETDDVQVVGNGAIDFRNDTIELAFRPQPKRKDLINIVTPFAVNGKLHSPTIEVRKGRMATRAVGEVAALPLNLFGLIAKGGQKTKKHKPCQIIQQKKAEPKSRARRSR